MYDMEESIKIVLVRVNGTTVVWYVCMYIYIQFSFEMKF